ncbi:MAG: hypothetical protein Q8R83_02890 [Legionellaceae bacterium]|nr:hypothetical protein [Legionellaceae bacterium]
MHLKYRAMSANCGNSSFGNIATKTIVDRIKLEKSDFYVINCQEVGHSTVTTQLLSCLKNSNYNVSCVGSMHTITKPSEFFSGRSGIASFIIYDATKFTVENLKCKELRRNNSRFAGTAYNKGGVRTLVTLKDKTTTESVTLEIISGHLDSNEPDMRALDWSGIQRGIAYPVSEVPDFEQLALIIPNIRLSGYDANTRNRFVEEHTTVNIWESNATELQAFIQFPLGGKRFSHDSTYTNTENAALIASTSKKRIGQTEGGMLDFVDVLDGTSSENIIRTEVILPNDKTTYRDHAVVISEQLEYTKPAPFNHVIQQMAAMLEPAAPELAKNIRCMEENIQSKSALVALYHVFLSSDQGLLHKEMELFVDKLALVLYTSKRKADNTTLVDEMKSELFLARDIPWFGLATLENFNQQIEIIQERQKQTKLTINTWKVMVNTGQRPISTISNELIRSEASTPTSSFTGTDFTDNEDTLSTSSISEDRRSIDIEDPLPLTNSPKSRYKVLIPPSIFSNGREASSPKQSESWYGLFQSNSNKNKERWKPLMGMDPAESLDNGVPKNSDRPINHT